MPDKLNSIMANIDKHSKAKMSYLIHVANSKKQTKRTMRSSYNRSRVERAILNLVTPHSFQYLT